MNNETNGAFVVSWDFSREEDKDLVIVGERKNGVMEVVNAFQGKNARYIYERLSKKEEN